MGRVVRGAELRTPGRVELVKDFFLGGKVESFRCGGDVTRANGWEID